jgi:hypothetical protein
LLLFDVASYIFELHILFVKFGQTSSDFSHTLPSPIAGLCALIITHHHHHHRQGMIVVSHVEEHVYFIERMMSQQSI